MPLKKNGEGFLMHAENEGQGKMDWTFKTLAQKLSHRTALLTTRGRLSCALDGNLITNQWRLHIL